MKLSTIFQQLVHGEFSQLSFGSGQGKLAPENYDAVLNHVNLGLSALYKRFAIKEGRLYLQLKEGQYVYPLKSDYALTSKKNVEKFILDSKANPFMDDINKVEAIITEGEESLAFNNPNDRLSAHMIDLTTIEFPRFYIDNQRDVPEKLRTRIAKVIYRAGYGPAICCPSHYAPEMVDVPLPDMYLEALLYFVAARVHNPIGMNQQFHQGNNYAAMYERECQKLEQFGLQMDSTILNDRFYRNGWC